MALLRALGARECDPAARNPDFLARVLAGDLPAARLSDSRPLRRLAYSGLGHRVARWIVERVSPGIYWYEIARVKHFDAILRDEVSKGVPQVVILGAGLDSRAYRLADELKGVRLFEADHPVTGARKRRRVTEVFGEPPAHLTYVDADLAIDELGERLNVHGFDAAVPVFVLWSGVTMYLPPEGVDSVLRWLADRPVGSSIAFDYAYRAFIDGNGGFRGAARTRRAIESGGERLRFGLDPDTLPEFLDERGLSLESHVGPGDLAEQHLRGSDGTVLGRPSDFAAFVHARVDVRGTGSIRSDTGSPTSFLGRHRWLALGVWLALLVASLPFTLRQTEHLTSGGFSVPGSDSEAVDRALAEFDAGQRPTLAVVIARPPGADPTNVRREIGRVAAVIERMPNVELPPGGRVAAEADAARSSTTIVALKTQGDIDDTADLAVDLRDELGIGDARHGGVQTYMVGEQALLAGIQDLSKEDLKDAEAIGFPIVLLILLAVFGSLVAAAMPLALGFFSVIITGAGIFFLSKVTDMSVYITNVASMIGIGVAVDYSLFILARYREEIRNGIGPAAARRIAMRTSGTAVAFSGVTVIVSLAGLFVVDSTTIRSMAMGAMLVIGVSILGALTLLPALMAVSGRRGFEPGRTAAAVSLLARSLRRLQPHRGAGRRPAEGGFWQRWTNRVTRHPVAIVALSATVMLALAVPALSLRTGDSALDQFPDENETRVGAELAMKKLGPGATGPIEVVAAFESGEATAPANRRALTRYIAAVKQDPEVRSVAPPVPSRDGGAALILITPRHEPEGEAARNLVDRLRDGASGGRALAEIADLDVGGTTAWAEDFHVQVSGSLWKIALFMLVLSYLVLFVLLRSVILPLKAVLMNLLSVAAAYGVLVAIFQYGWIDGLLGFESLGYINTLTPPLLLAVVFGLSMDYEVFLLSRIKERYDATGDSRKAVTQGLARSAATISSAALIMVAVFAVFTGVGVPSVKEFGAGLAVAIALDATIVRLLLVPATMEIMGRWNWWIPRPLGRVLPEIRLRV